MKIISAIAAVILSTVSAFPLFKQCDSRWGTNALGNYGGNTICSAGCTMSSLSMILNNCGELVNGQAVNPGTLNSWL